MRDLWAGNNRISSLEPLARLPVLHEVVLRENPVSLAEVEALEGSLSSWDAEFADPNPQIEPALEVEVVSQEVWDYYDTHPFNMAGDDGNAGMHGSEKSWLSDQVEAALGIDWVLDEDFSVPWKSPRARSFTVCLLSVEAAQSLRSIAAAIQRILRGARNEFIVYLQTDCCGDDAPDYIVWVYRSRLLVTPETVPIVTALLTP